MKKMTGIELITKEREEQLQKHGWTPQHDDQHYDGSLVHAAISAMLLDGDFFPENWDLKYFNKFESKTLIDRMKVAGALIAAEIDRLQREGQEDSNENDG